MLAERSSSAPRWRCWFRYGARGRTRPVKATIARCRGRQCAPAARARTPPRLSLCTAADTVRVENVLGAWALVTLDERRTRLHQSRLHRSGARSDDRREAGRATEIARRRRRRRRARRPSPPRRWLRRAPAIDRELAALRERLASLEASLASRAAPAPHAHARGARNGGVAAAGACAGDGRAAGDPRHRTLAGPGRGGPGGRFPHRHVLRLAAGAQPPFPRSLLRPQPLVSAKFPARLLGNAQSLGRCIVQL